MLVERLLSSAQDKLFTTKIDDPLIMAARMLYNSDCDMVVVSDHHNQLAGVITKTDIVRQISICEGSSCATIASSIMSENVLSCFPTDWLQVVWDKMKDRHLKNLPILDSESRPVGVLNARDALQSLLSEVENEEKLLRDYVMCVGYQ